MKNSPLTKELAKFEWANFYPRQAAICLPAMALALVLGFALHQPAAGIVAASASFSVGLGAFRRLQGSGLLPMFLTVIGMSFAASLGTLTGHSMAMTVMLSGGLGLLYGLVLIFSEDASWVGLQCVIAFLVASAFPAYSWHAFLRGLLVLVGGVLQITIHVFFWRRQVEALRADFRRCHPRDVLCLLWEDIRPALVRHVDHRLGQMRYAIRLGLTLMAAVALSRLLHQVNSYWLPMTTLIVMKPDFYRTYTSSLGRVFGTFLGILVASALTLLLHPHPLVLVVLVLIFAWNAFAWQKVNYAIFSSMLTAWIVFLIATAGLPEVVATANRLSDTAIGSAIALASRAIGPSWDSIRGLVVPVLAKEPSRVL